MMMNSVDKEQLRRLFWEAMRAEMICVTERGRSGTVFYDDSRNSKMAKDNFLDYLESIPEA